MKNILIFILFLLFLIFSLSADNLFNYIETEGIKVINDRDYIEGVVELFNNAKKTIHIMIYQARIYKDYSGGAYERIYSSIFDAVKRGVEVVIIVDQSDWNPSSTLQNEEFAEYMREGGVKVYFDPVDVTTHSKVIVIDSFYTVIGSMNWSYYALEKNTESSVIIKSGLLAEVYLKYFDRLLHFSSEELETRR